MSQRVDSNERTNLVIDAHYGDGKRFVVRADEKLTAFLELESVTRGCGELASTADEIFPRLPGYEDKHSTSSSYNCARLLCALPDIASTRPKHAIRG